MFCFLSAKCMLYAMCMYSMIVYYKEPKRLIRRLLICFVDYTYLNTVPLTCLFSGLVRINGRISGLLVNDRIPAAFYRGTINNLKFDEIDRPITRNDAV